MNTKVLALLAASSIFGAEIACAVPNPTYNHPDSGFLIAQSSIDYTVPGYIPVMAQPSTMTCWATAAAILLSWQNQGSYSPEQAAAMAGSSYSQKFRSNQGLNSNEAGRFLSTVGLRKQPLQGYTIRRFTALLQSKGPILTTTRELAGLHARIVTGIYGDGTPNGTSLKVIDPAGGRQYTERFSDFMRKYDRAQAETGFAVQIVHF
jgi:hypothetical protein